MITHITNREYDLSQKDPVARRLDWIVFSLEELTSYRGIERRGRLFSAFIALASVARIPNSSISKYLVENGHEPLRYRTKTNSINHAHRNNDIRICDAISTIKTMLKNDTEGETEKVFRMQEGEDTLEEQPSHMHILQQEHRKEKYTIGILQDQDMR